MNNASGNYMGPCTAFTFPADDKKKFPFCKGNFIIPGSSLPSYSLLSSTDFAIHE
jgi:hypothetical protein